jgi:hypothetical protein
MFTLSIRWHFFNRRRIPCIFSMPKYGDVRAQNLLSWYSAGDSVTDLYNIMQMTDPRKIKHLCQFLVQVMHISVSDN